MALRPDLQHRTYLEHASTWGRIADCLRGGEHMRSRGDAYLPMLWEHRRHPATYTDYVSRAVFPDMTSRMVEALSGAVFRKDPSVEVPSRYRARLDDIDGRGNNIRTFAKQVVEQVLSFGRCGILVDSAATTVDDPLRNKPHLVFYSAEDIVNWRVERRLGRDTLTQVVLREVVDVPAAFGVEARTQYRVLELDEAGAYTSTTYTGDAQDSFVQDEPAQASNFAGLALGAIPFVFVSPTDLSPTVRRSPVSGVADLDVSWFKSSADLEHARHLCATPTLVISSTMEAADLHIGGTLWLPEGSTCTLLEFRGDGLEFLERALVEKERVASMLGARLLGGQVRGSEASETVRLRQSAETATISSIARNVSEAMAKAISVACEWGGIDGKVTFELSQDYLDATLSAQEVKELRDTALAGLLPFDEFVRILQRGEIIRSDLSVEDVREMLETGPVPGISPVRLADPDEPQGDEPPVRPVP